jgi:SAM-dependent methyltransferase/uncharacterized protein YbaR (Trm112 family)
MRTGLIEFLCCPSCKADLDLVDDTSSGRTVVSGALRCSGCGERYPIRQGVPDFVSPHDDESVQQTTSGFADNWQHYNRVILANENLNRDLFSDWLWPLPPTHFEDKIVVEAGCGMGRWLRLAAEHRPRTLIGFDYSPIARTAAKNTAHLPNVHVIQADIFRLPIKPIVDVNYSIGVVHHTPDPQRAFRSLVDSLSPDGVITAWVYGQENNEWITTLVDPVRKRVTSKLPVSVLKVVSLAAAAQLRLVSSAYVASGAPSWLPYRDYMVHLKEYPFDYMSHIVYDHLVPSIANYLSRDEMLAWVNGTTLSWVLSPRNANSWRMLAARTPEALQRAIVPETAQTLQGRVESNLAT